MHDLDSETTQGQPEFVERGGLNSLAHEARC